VQAVVPLVIVNVAPLLVHPPDEAYTTASPELAFAATMNEPLYTAPLGAAVVTVMLCAAARTVSVMPDEVSAV